MDGNFPFFFNLLFVKKHYYLRKKQYVFIF